MPRWLGLTIFISIAIALLVGIHLYLWWRLVRDPQLLPPWRTIATLALVGLALLIPAVFILSPLLSSHWRPFIAWPAFVWMGTMFILLVVLAGADVSKAIGLGVARLFSSGAPPAVEIRLLLARTLAVAALGATILLVGVALFTARASFVVREIEVILPGLSPEMDGSSIVLLTDLHVGSILGRDFVGKVVRATNELEPDVVVIAGDLVDYSVEHLAEAVSPLADLRAREGVFFVTGNHEYYAGVEGWLSELKRLGIRVLLNEHVVIGNEADGYVLAGVNDLTGNMYPGHATDLPKALEGRDPNKPVVLLAHQPLVVKEAANQGVALQLSGHTHHGQIWPFNYAVVLQQPYVRGLVRHEQTQLYTSPGTGYWGPPMRLGTRSEITHLVLRAPDLETTSRN